MAGALLVECREGRGWRSNELTTFCFIFSFTIVLVTWCTFFSDTKWRNSSGSSGEEVERVSSADGTRAIGRNGFSLVSMYS